MKKQFHVPGLRLSGTSFLLHDSYIPAVRFTAEHCDDVSLLLLQIGDTGEYLPSAAEVREIARILDGEGAGVHVHLPTDAHCGTPEDAQTLAEHVLMAAECTAELSVHSYVLHLDYPGHPQQEAGRPPEYDKTPNNAAVQALHPAITSQEQHCRTQLLHAGTPIHPCRTVPSPYDTQIAHRTMTPAQYEWTAEALEKILTTIPAEKLCIENLETYPPCFWDDIIKNFATTRCMDAGHIWKDGGRPELLLNDWLPAIRILHIHGMIRRPDGSLRDHKALSRTPAEQLDALLFPLWEKQYNGIILPEVFNIDDFTASHAALCSARQRYLRKKETGD